MHDMRLASMAIAIVFGIVVAGVFLIFGAPIVILSEPSPGILTWSMTAFLAVVVSFACIVMLVSSDANTGGEYGIVLGGLSVVILLAGAFVSLIWGALNTFATPFVMSLDHDARQTVYLAVMIVGGVLFTVIIIFSIWSFVLQNSSGPIASMVCSVVGALSGVATGYLTGTHTLEGLAIWCAGGLTVGLALALVMMFIAKMLQRRRFAH
jgi:hypothetical protein